MNLNDRNLDEGAWDSVKNAATTFKKHEDLVNYWNKKQRNFRKHITDSETLPLDKYEEYQKAYDLMNNSETSNAVYRSCFAKFCKLFNLLPKSTMIEWISIRKNAENVKITIRYSDGLVKVALPEDTVLVHVSPVGDIDALRPSRKARADGKFFYPTPRVFFTIKKSIDVYKAGLEAEEKLHAYTPVSPPKYAYIDPTNTDYKTGAVFIPTYHPIKVTTKHISGVTDDKSNTIKTVKDLTRDLLRLTKSLGSGDFSTIKTKWELLCQHAAKNVKGTFAGRKIAKILAKKPKDKEDATEQIAELNAEIKNIKEAEALAEAAEVFLSQG